VTESGFLDALMRRAGVAGLAVSEALSRRLFVYFALLRTWNQKINLTGFRLDSPTDAAIDRLLVEPLFIASRLERPIARMADVGTGGGSPAFPMFLSLAPREATFIEARSRKAIFLREVARELGVAAEVEIRNGRFEEFVREPGLAGRFDLMTSRAVKLTAADLADLAALLAAGGLFVEFGAAEQAQPLPHGLSLAGEVRLPTLDGGRAVMLRSG
jgi:16S rRNA (guanine527-N7)-methyltransferase